MLAGLRQWKGKKMKEEKKSIAERQASAQYFAGLFILAGRKNCLNFNKRQYVISFDNSLQCNAFNCGCCLRAIKLNGKKTKFNSPLHPTNSYCSQALF